MAKRLWLVIAPLFVAAIVQASYPVAEPGDVVDDYHGVKVADPYRWLEDAGSEQTQRWMNEQNAFTQNYLARDDNRDPIRARLAELLNYPRTSVPGEKNGRLFFSHNSGLQNQSIYFVQDGLDGEPRELIDPNTWREDGTAAIRSFTVSPKGNLVAYGVSLSGSDWQEVHVRDVNTGQDLADVMPYVKFVSAAWLPDETGFYYARQPEPGSVPAGDEHYYQKLYYHALGDDPKNDRVVYERPSEETKTHGFAPTVTHDGKYLVVHIWRGSAADNEISFRPLMDTVADLTPLFAGFDAAYQFIGSEGDRFFFRTNKDALKWKIVSVDVTRPGVLADVVPEGRDLIESATLANGELVVQTLRNAHSRIHRYSLSGESLGEIALPSICNVTGISGEPDSDLLFVGFNSFLTPGSVYRYDYATGELKPHSVPEVDFDADNFVTRQIWYESKDGTKVPMFLVHKKGLVLDGNNPTLLYGYGGFNVNQQPHYSATRLFWLEQGGVYAVPNLRGGGEFGEEWHRAGMLEKKQNVFDDFIAAAEWLIANDYTRSERLVIHGGSNGGLLTAACMVQRPDLFGVVLVGVPVIDMLRYHLFTVARYWIPEYGSSEDPEQFKFLIKYSPLHNVKPGGEYPSTLVLTADTDDRVDPGQAKKFAATLQKHNASNKPMLIRVDIRAGHGGGKPTSKSIEEGADTFGFVLKEMGLPVKTRNAEPSS